MPLEQFTYSKKRIKLVWPKKSKDNVHLLENTHFSNKQNVLSNYYFQGQ